MKKKLKPRLIIITGLSGAGKTQALKYFEDVGFFCIDNMPTFLIPKFLQLYLHRGRELKDVALGIDIREGEFLEDVEEVFLDLSERGIGYKILFLECSDEVLLRRFSETRRRHPLGDSHTILEHIAAERKRLSLMREKANFVVDTSNFTISGLRSYLQELFDRGMIEQRLLMTVISFGYKFGIPLEADLIFDVRFLPNPNYIERLMSETGEDKDVVDYVMSSPITSEFLEMLFNLMKFLIPKYIAEGRSYLTVGIGCTGGRHRAVVIANALAEFINKLKLNIKLKTKHRDIKKQIE